MADLTMARNGDSGFDPAASWGRLSERVEHQGRDLIDLRSNMNTGFQNLQHTLSGLANEFRGSSRTQWPIIWSAIGVCFTMFAAVGTLAYWPVLDNQDRLEAALMRLSDTVGVVSEKSLSRDEANWRGARTAEDRARTEAALTDLRNSTVTRLEWSERNGARSQEIGALRDATHSEDANLQRQIDQLRQDFGSIYGTRDIIQDLKKEVDTLRQRFNSGRYPPA